MKKLFLDRLSNSGQDLDNLISRFMDIKEKIGNGVGAGKLFESVFVDFINKKLADLYSLHLNLSNSHFIWDILVSDTPIDHHRQQIVQIIRNNSDNKVIESAITNLIGDRWLGVSLKTYKLNACQITTDYSYRTFLENSVGESFASEQTLIDFFGLLNKHDSNRYVTLALNTFSEIDTIESKITELKKKPLTETIQKKIDELEAKKSTIHQSKYSIRLLSFDKKFDKIYFKINKKLSQYNLSINGKNFFKVLYGKNQANPFQRGIWTHDKYSLAYFPLVYNGIYKLNTNYFSSTILSTINQ